MITGRVTHGGNIDREILEVDHEDLQVYLHQLPTDVEYEIRGIVRRFGQVDAPVDESETA